MLNSHVQTIKREEQLKLLSMGKEARVRKMDGIKRNYNDSWVNVSKVFHGPRRDKAFDCVDHNKLENSSRDGNTRPPDLPLVKSVCRSGSSS